ncbi:hypothetical protein PILCRDRAFT_142479 [Piloderma croceum F 1598]|uniref:RRM domain-containing protein n=1 Tax=Piloderma croceum (strain F 1598) TaxID=765440 RepID=A0A0C3BVX9_PILCF|nr:hypothetical protein PILCRDRAFT_142479 [Piloderma croceum F 1598]
MSSSCTRLYLGGLPHFVGVDEVSKHLAGYGKLVEVKIHRGYGFIAFDKEKDASDVFEVFSKHPFMGTNITVEYARPLHKAKAKDVCLTSSKGRYGSVHAKLRYPVAVTNIPRGACWQELKDFGRQAGGFVAFCNIDKPQNGTGFIEYTSRDDAHHAVRRLNGTKLHGNVVALSMRENDENRKPVTDLRARSRSPPRDRPAYKLCSTSSSSTSFAETSLDRIDSYNDSRSTRSRCVYEQRGRTSTDTSITEPSFDLHSYGVTSRDAFAPSFASNGDDYDYYDYCLLRQYEEGKHRPGAGYYDTDPGWAYM